MKRRIFLGATAGLLAAPWAARAQAVPKGGYGVGVTGLPALPADFHAFPYVNADAPKGGAVTFSQIGGFDSFNPVHHPRNASCRCELRVGHAHAAVR